MQQNIPASEFHQRRVALTAVLPADSVAILPAAKALLRNGDAFYKFRQQSDFYYFTRVTEPEAVAVFLPGREQGEFVLFCQPRDPIKERWEGPMMGLDGACAHYGADEAYSIDELDKIIVDLLSHRQSVYYPFGQLPGLDKRVQQWFHHMRTHVRKGLHAPSELNDLRAIMHELRLIKSDNEINLMRHNCQHSAQAHIRAMQAASAATTEYELEAELLHRFIHYGCRAPAYESIVASGANACTLHYTANNSPLKSDDLILIDAGGEYEYYAADITRTFPKSGKFTGLQKDIYQCVLDAQSMVLNYTKPGTPFDQLQTIAVRYLTQGLVDLKLLSGNVDDLIETKAYQQYYMHNIGHWLGIDVHDVGEYKIQGQWRVLQPGMVLTIEPGLYLPEHNIGVRIEDDIFITASGHEVLSGDAIKSIDDIEAAMAV